VCGKKQAFSFGRLALATQRIAKPKLRPRKHEAAVGKFPSKHGHGVAAA
jgi:hypothetical protein